MDREWEFHLEERTRALVAEGLPEHVASERARREFGDPLRWKEQSREARGIRWLREVGADLSYALRQVRRAPGFAAVVVATLSLGIGANTAIFSIVNALLLQPLPVEQPDRLVVLSDAASSPSPRSHTFAVWNELRQRAALFAGAFAVAWDAFDLSDGGEVRPIDVMYASGEFFDVLGTHALVGRTFTASDDAAGAAAPVAVISYGFWQRHYHGEPDAVGGQLRIHGVPFTVIGVTSRDFFGVEVGRSFDVALPLGAERLIRRADSVLDRQGWFFLAVGFRLRPDQSIEAATAVLRTFQPAIRAAAMPDTQAPQLKDRFLAEPFALLPAATGWSWLRDQYERPLIIVLGVVAIVLLIGCANLVNLLLARAAARVHELRIRIALGAGRWRLGRQLFVETLLLALAGGLCGAAVAPTSARLLISQLSMPGRVTVLDAPIDLRVLTFTSIVALSAALISGVAPALRGARAASVGLINLRGPDSLRGSSGRLWSGLIVVQVALSLITLVGAGLLLRTLVGIATMPRGFDAERILLVHVDVSRSPVVPGGRHAFFARAPEVISAVPGVAIAAASMNTPVGGGWAYDQVEVADALPPVEGELRYKPWPLWSSESTAVNYVTPGWFLTYGIKVSRGRGFTQGDMAGAEPVAVVNAAFVRKFLQGREPIGALVTHRMGMGSPRGTTRGVVGVVSDAVFDQLRSGVLPVLYSPLGQYSFPPVRTTMTISARSANGSPGTLSPAIAEALTRLDPNLSFTFRPLQDRVNAAFVQERVLAALSAFFGLLALLLAVIGLYGVTAYGVSRQRGEIGIRLALGASRHLLVMRVVSRVLLMVLAGILCGGVATLWLSRFVETLLFGVDGNDPTTFIVSASILAAAGGLAAWLSAARVSRIDPAEVLRDA